MSKLLQYLVNKPSVKHKVLPGLRKMQMAGQYNAERDATSINTPALSKLFGVQREIDVNRFSEDAFKEKYKMTPHQYKMRTDSDYAQAWKRQMDAVRQNPNYSELNLPATDIRSKNYRGNPNLALIPKGATGPARAQQEQLFADMTSLSAPLLPVKSLVRGLQVGKAASTAPKIIDKLISTPSPVKTAATESADNSGLIINDEVYRQWRNARQSANIPSTTPSRSTSMEAWGTPDWDASIRVPAKNIEPYRAAWEGVERRGPEWITTAVRDWPTSNMNFVDDTRSILNNVTRGIDRKLGQLFSKGTKAPAFDADEVARLINENLSKGVGVKKENLPLQVKLVPTGYSPNDFRIETLIDNNKVGSIFLQRNMNPYKPKTFSELFLNRAQTPFERWQSTPGFRKKGDYPFQDYDVFNPVKDPTGKTFNTANDLYATGISGEFNKAINEAFKAKGLGNVLSGGTGHSMLGEARWKKLVEKGLAEDLGAGYFKLKKQGGPVILPKMQMAGQNNNVPQRISINDPRYAELYKNRQVGSFYDDAYSLPDLDEVTVTGKDERLKEGMSQGSSRFLQGLAGVMGSPQTGLMEVITGKQQTPSQAWGFDTKGKSWYNPKSISNFAMDAALDPMNAFGVGLVDDVTRGAVRAGAKQAARRSGNYLTTKTPLKNAYRYNPWAFKPNADTYYRVVDNPTAAGLTTRSVNPGGYWNKGLPLDIRTAKAAPRDSRLAYHGYPGPYLIENKGANMKSWIQFPEPELDFYTNVDEIPLSNQTKVYKEDWLRGYKPVKKIGGPVDLPKMQMRGEVNLPGSQTISVNDPRYPEMYKNRQVGAYYDGAFTLPDLDEVVVRGKDERIKEGMSQGINKFYGHASELMSAPQTEMMKFLTGKRQTPSQAWGFDTTNKSWYHPKTVSNFLMDAALDPTNLIGVGLLDDLTKGAVRAAAQNTVSKTLQRGLSPWGYDFENIARVPQNLIRNLEGKSKKLSSAVQKSIDEGKAQFVLPALKNREDAWSTYLGLDRDFNTMKLVGSDDATGLSKYEYTNPIVFEKSSPRPNPKTGTQTQRIDKALYDTSEGRLYNKRILKNEYVDDVDIIDLNVPGSSAVGNDKLFGTMGGFQKYVSPDGKHLMYRDVWDLQPFSRLTSSQLPRDMVGNAIRRFEVSSLIPGARPFVAEGKLGDIKTKFLPAKPYKDIRTRYNEQLSWARNAFEPDAFIRDLDNPTPEEIFAYDQAIKNTAKRNLIDDIKNKKTFLNPAPARAFEKYVDTNPYTRFGDSTPDLTGFDFSPSTPEKLLKKIQNIGNQPVSKFNMGGPILDPRGQWAHPGKRTIVPTPTGRITMQGVPYPVYGQDETGFGQMMYPGGEYKFPGQIVDEIPMMQPGGQMRSGNDFDDYIFNPLAKKLANLSRSASQMTNDALQKVTDLQKITAYTSFPTYAAKAHGKVNRWLFDNIRPVQYPTLTSGIKNISMGLLNQNAPPQKDSKGLYNVGEEAWQKALSQQPIQSHYIIPSKYKPSDAKDPNAKYYTLREGIIDPQLLIEEVKRRNLKDNEVAYMPSLTPFIRKGFMSEDEFSNIDPLQKFKLMKGSDDKGNFVSIYDKYDFEGPLNSLIVPYEFYDRYYYKKNGGQHGGLDRWFAEKWVDVKTGKACGRQEGEKRAGYPACRPSKRVSSETPKTSSEMSSAEKAKFKRTKTSSERIPYNHKK